MTVVATTDRLVLRRIEPGDLDDLVTLDADPEVMRYISGGEATPLDVMRDDRLPMMTRVDSRSPDLGYCAGLERDGGRFIGWFALGTPSSQGLEDAGPGDFELGYRLRQEFWRQGYAAEGSRALIDRAFGDLGADRVLATTMTVNGASRRVMEKVGLTYVRTFHGYWPDPIPGTAEGDVVYAITRDEWQRARS